MCRPSVGSGVGTDALAPANTASASGGEAQGDDEGLHALKAAVAGTTEENQATLLLKKRKDMRMVEETLENVKREFKQRMELLAARQLRFEEKQRALQEMIAKFRPFIEEVRPLHPRSPCMRVHTRAA
ncbi:DUF4200 domain-containing protein [archaeon]|nr:MAG: DUF4200 domain-containing protein [archaeon]